MMYSKSDLLQLILDNEQKTGAIETASPLINATEAVHGALTANFVLNPRAIDSVRSIALGKINDGPEAQNAMFARATSRNSVQYLTEDRSQSNFLGNTKTTKTGTSFLNDTYEK